MHQLPVLLSEVLAGPNTRRAFLARAAALGGATFGGAALAGCGPGAPRSGTPGASAAGTASTDGAPNGGTPGGAARGHATQNADSKLDTLQAHGAHPTSAGTAGAAQAAPYHRYDPALPPLSAERTLRLHWEARALPGNAIRGVQTFAVAPGGGMIFELVADVPGEFPFVNHRFGHGQKGAIGFLVVEA